MKRNKGIVYTVEDLPDGKVRLSTWDGDCSWIRRIFDDVNEMQEFIKKYTEIK